MHPESVLVYERVLQGERWPVKYVGTATTTDRSMEILKYLFFEKLQYTDYDTAKAYLTSEFVEQYKLKPIIRYIDKPPELLPTEYDHVLWCLFPERKKGNHALIIKVYKEVLSGKRKCFPKGYFTDPKLGRYRAETCIKYMCRKIMHLSGDEIAKEFSHSSGLKTLSKYKLKIVMNHVYVSLSEMMNEVYPQFYPRLEYYQALQDQRHFRKDKRNGNIERICNPSGEKSRSGGDNQ